MIYLHHILTSDRRDEIARVWGCCAYANAAFCSKHILAEALFEDAQFSTHPEIQEVVCASSGNLAISIALLSLRYGVHATIYLPSSSSKRTVNLLGLLGATVVRCQKAGLSEEIAPMAKFYASTDASRIFLDQFDLAWCSQAYTRVIFEPLAGLFPLEGQTYRVCMIVPCGTGSLLIAAARFLSEHQGGMHQLIPVFFDEPSSSKQGFLATCQADFPGVEICPAGIPTWEETRNAFRSFSAMFEIPFGMTSANCIAVALARQQKFDDSPVDMISILTDAFVCLE